MRRAFLVLAMLSACASDKQDSATYNGPGSVGPGSSLCVALDGVYQVTYLKKSGDCADMSPRLVRYADGSSDQGDSECTETDEVSDDGCDHEVVGTCSQVSASGVMTTLKVTAVFTQTGNTKFEGTFNVDTNTSSGQSCHSIYDVTAVRL